MNRFKLKLIITVSVLYIGFLPYISMADITYLRTPDGSDITNPVTFSVSALKFSDFGFKEEDKINSWNFVIYDDHSNVYLAGCAPKTALSLVATAPLGFGGSFDGVALGAHYDENCQSDTDIPNVFLESNNANDIIFNVAGPLVIQNLQSPTRVTSFRSGTGYFLNIGKTGKIYTTCNVTAYVSTALIYGSWAELGIFKSSTDTNGNITFSKIGFTDVSNLFNTTGQKSVDISLDGEEVGNNLWLGLGSQAFVPFQLKGITGKIQDGLFQMVEGKPSLEGTTVKGMPASFIPPSATAYCE